MDTETNDTGTAAEEEVDFASLGLSNPVLQAVAERGYIHPTSIQVQAIPLLLQGRDLIGGSQTGTGKTAAFVLPVLTRLKKHGALRCLVLEPTRELAQQVYSFFEDYGKYLDMRIALLYGGVGYGKQRDALKKGADIVVATPGRLLDHLSQKALDFGKIEFLILDEADRMLDMGFMPDVRRIVGRCPRRRQSLLFSATVSSALEKLAAWVLRDPVRITIGTGTSVVDTVNHAIYPVDTRQKFDLLLALLQKDEFNSVIIFCRTKVGADIIARWLENAGHSVTVLHSNRSQKERDQALDGFKDGRFEVLVATDIVARGIDITGVSHVINYDIPQHAQDYVHRIGRTGRMQNLGDAVTLYTAEEKEFLKAIERFIDQKIPIRKLDEFDYAWTPVLEEKKEKPRRRNQGFSTKPVFGRSRRSR